MQGFVDWFTVENILITLLVFVVASLLGYFARRPAHHLIQSFFRAGYSGFRMAAYSMRRAEQAIRQRNKEVLLEAGREAQERMIEREFERVETSINRDLIKYPVLQRKLSDVVEKIDESYKESAEVPPSPPGWTSAVATVAEIPTSKDPMVVDILSGIQDSLSTAHNKAIEEYRANSKTRHNLLKKMYPHWVTVKKLIGEVERKYTMLLERSRSVDRHMDHYEEIVAKSDKATRMLSSSSITQFFIAGFVLAIAVGGAMINFNLIARPMQEMVGGASYILGFKVSNIAAMVIILVEIALGLFLMESLRITRLFPTISALDDKIRVRMVWASFIMLFLLASIEAGLAYMRELLAQDDAALISGLLNSGQQSVGEGNRMITTAAQMGMGFILPFALTFIAIPLESFIQSSRTVIGVLVLGFLQMFRGVLHVLASTSRYLGRSMVDLYDLFIFGPLWVESMVKQQRKTDSPSSETKKSTGKRTKSQEKEDKDMPAGTAVGVS